MNKSLILGSFLGVFLGSFLGVFLISEPLVYGACDHPNAELSRLTTIKRNLKQFNRFNFNLVPVIFTIKNTSVDSFGDSAKCTFFATIDRGRHDAGQNTRFLEASNGKKVPYNLYARSRASDSFLIKPFSDVTSADNTLQHFEEKFLENEENDIAFWIHVPDVFTDGDLSYTDELEITIHEGSVQQSREVVSKKFDISLKVDPDISINMDQNVLDFDQLESNEVLPFSFTIQSNVTYDLDVFSRYSGHLVLTDVDESKKTNTPEKNKISYHIIYGSNLIDEIKNASSATTVITGADLTNEDGVSYDNFKVKVKDTSNKTAGSYQDTVTFVVKLSL